MDTDVVVIGAGALGLSTALHCALAGRSVTVLERLTAGSQASGRAAGLFKSVQADELRTRLARRSITLAATFAEWAGEPLAVAAPGSFLIARTGEHREYLRRELAQARGWGADVREAEPGRLAAALSFYQPNESDFALWCPEDIYIEEPTSLIVACLAAGRRLGVDVAENEPVTGILVSGGRVTGVETGQRTITAPGVDGLWVASGCNGSGFSSSLGIGEGLASWITAGDAMGMEALAPGRFGPLGDEELVSRGSWQYAHYYDPAPA